MTAALARSIAATRIDRVVRVMAGLLLLRGGLRRRALADLLPAADRQSRADAVPARPLADPCQAPAGRDQEDRPFRRSDRRGHAGSGRLLDTERTPSSARASETESRVVPGDSDS